MVGQCVFCSWYGIQLRRATYLVPGPGLYHPHCVRVALNSPDPADRTRAEVIFKTEMPRLARERFWEMNLPTRTANPAVAVQTLSVDDCDQICRESRMGTAETICDLLGSERALPPGPQEAVATATPLLSLPAGNREEGRAAEARRLWERGHSCQAIAAQLGLDPHTVAAWERELWRRPRSPRSNVDRAIEIVSRFSEAEMQQFQERARRFLRSGLLPGGGPTGALDEVTVFVS
jgi:hypothetical protein